MNNNSVKKHVCNISIIIYMCLHYAWVSEWKRVVYSQDEFINLKMMSKKRMEISLGIFRRTGKEKRKKAVNYYYFFLFADKLFL